MISAAPSLRDTFLPSNWRWERVRWLREHGRYVRRGNDDPFTLIARDYADQIDFAELHRLPLDT